MKKEKPVLSPYQPHSPTKAEKEKKIAQAIKVLNEIVKVRLGKSDIDGIGVIAMRDIKKGEKLYTDALVYAFDVPYKDFDKLRPEVAGLLLGRWPLITTGSHFFYPDAKHSAYLNHSDTPNYDAKKDKALKDIHAGEEVFEDYRVIEGHEKVFPWLASPTPQKKDDLKRVKSGKKG